MLTQSQQVAVAGKATQYGIEPAAAMAFIETESNGTVFATVNGDKVPLIRYEGHYFDKLVPASRRAEARKQKLASPKVGGIANPSSQAGRYALLARAKAFDHAAAIASTSYGVGQVMGENWKDFGLKSAQEFENIAMSGFEGQIDLMFRFIEVNGLKKFINAKDWTAVARAYNGPAYAKNAYDVKMRDAYIRYSKSLPEKNEFSGMLRLGSKGPEVRVLQNLLVRAGHTVKADADFGPATVKAVKDFQIKYFLTPDGVVGPKTYEKLLAYKASPTEVLGSAKLIDIPEVKQAAVPFVSVVAVTTLKEQLLELSAQLGVFGVGLLDQISAYVNIGASVIGVGIAIYAIKGWWDSKKNVHGIEDK
jgi:hypothetical protein